MTFALERKEAAKRVGKLSEGQRIEFRRRLDSCYAVMGAAQPLVYERKEQSDAVQERNRTVKPWWFGAVALGVIGLHWLGRTLELGFLVGTAYFIGFVGIWSLVQILWTDWLERSRVKELDRDIQLLRYFWLATGAHPDTFRSYRSIAERGEWYFDGTDSAGILAELGTSLLMCVEDLSAWPFYLVEATDE